MGAGAHGRAGEKPSCSPTLNGADLGLDNGRERGSKGSVDYDKGDTAFYHAQVFAFSILLFLDFFFDGACLEDGSDVPGLDILYLSEIDPTWNNDELNVFLYPESLLLANPIALAACLADVAAAEIREAIDPLFFCVGSWGHLYPVAGHHLQHCSMPRNTSLLGSRTLAQLHRLGLARRTMGDDTVCTAQPEPFLPKTQYQWSVFYPVPDANGKHPTRQVNLSLGREPGHPRHRRGLRLIPLALAGLLPDRLLRRMIAMHRLVKIAFTFRLINSAPAQQRARSMARSSAPAIRSMSN